MKKFFALLIAAVICMSTCICAFADMDSPTFFKYEKTITAKDGAATYDYDYQFTAEDGHSIYAITETGKILPFGTKVTVNGKYEKGGIEYAYCYITDSSGDLRPRFIKTSDLESKLPEYEFSDMVKLIYPNKVVVINPDGIRLRCGPDEIFPFSSKVIPYGTELLCTYENSDSTPPWSYTEYNGERGWFESLQFDFFYNCAEKVDEMSCYEGTMTVYGSETKLLKSLDYGEGGREVLATVPVGTKLTFDRYYSLAHGFAVYTEYNGQKGWIEQIRGNNVTPESTENLIDIKGIGYCKNGGKYKLYAEAKNTDNFKEITIPDRTFFDYTGFMCYGDEAYIGDIYSSTDYFWYKVNINGQSGWLYKCEEDKTGYESRIITDGSDLDGICFSSSSTYLIVKKDSVQLKSEPDANSDTIGNISSGEMVNYQIWSDEWMYVLANGKAGWIKLEGNEYEHSSDSMNNNGWKNFDAKDFDFSLLDYSTEEPEKFDMEYYQKIADGIIPEISATEAETELSTEHTDTGNTVQKHMSPVMIAVCCAAAAAVLAVTAVVIIKLVNRKNKSEQ